MKKFIALSFLLLPTLACIAQNYTQVNTCLVENGELKTIVTDYNPRNGEYSLLVGGVRKKLEEAYPSLGKDYAGGQAWFINNDTVTFKGKPYRKYGLPRILNTNEIEKNGMFNGVGVYIEAGITGIVEVIYIPVRRGCEFQPYQVNCKKLYIEETGKPNPSSMSFIASISDEPGKINYTWTSPGMKIIKGQGSKTISIDIKNKKEDEEFRISLYATAGKKCWLSSDPFVVRKKKTIQP